VPDGNGEKKKNKKLLLSISQYCCKKECLKLISFREAERIFDKFNFPKIEKYEKIRELLRSFKCEDILMPEILGTHYKIRFEFEEGQFTYFCPTALKYLLHVGMSTLQLLAGNGDILSIPSRTTEIRETKIDQCSTWIRVLLFQLCIKDESNPTYFRCDYFASETEAAQFYLKYLRDTYPQDESRSICSPSTFHASLVRECPNLLWGEDGHCSVCFLYNSEIRKLWNDLKLVRGTAKFAVVQNDLKLWNEKKVIHLKVCSVFFFPIYLFN
jgi:hypothetical protein